MSNTNNTSQMNLEEYKTYINNIVNRLISEKQIYVLEENIDNKKILKIQFKQIEWYTELDDDIKYNVEKNLQRYFIKKLVNNHKTNNEELHNNEELQNNDLRNHNNIPNKRQKLN